MPTVFTHPAPAMAAAAALGCAVMPPLLVILAIIVAILPDLDVVGFSCGIRYADVLGHRGFSHPLAFAFLLGMMAFACAPLLKSRRMVAFGVIFGVALSHILLDAATTGGLGVAFFWPFDNTRYFLPWRPIVVSPFSPKAFLTTKGMKVILSELRWVWAPSLFFALVGFAARKSMQVFRRRNVV